MTNQATIPHQSTATATTGQTTATATTGQTTGLRRPVAERRRGVNIAVWVLQVLLAGTYVMAAFPKVTANPQAVTAFTEMGLGTTGMYIIGALELAGAIALLIPRLCGLAGAAFVALMIGAVIATVLTTGATMAVLPAAVLVLVSVVAWTRRQRTTALVNTLRAWARAH
jgi:hypothetical protein